MSITVTLIGGVPASGKSTLMEAVLRRLAATEKPRPFAVKLLRGSIFARQRCIVFGIYDGKPFPGTDRLSMMVQPETIGFLEHIRRATDYDGYRIFLEGDRLCNAKFLNALAAASIPVNFYLLEVSPEEQQRRFRLRDSNQPIPFLKGRATKYNRLKAAFPHTVLLSRADDRNDARDGNAAWVYVVLNGEQANLSAKDPKHATATP